MSTHIIAFRQLVADRDRSGGGAFVRRVTVGAQERSVVCKFQSPWPRPRAEEFLPKAAKALGVPEGALRVFEVTDAQFRSIDDQIYGAARAAEESDRQSKADAYRAEARTLLESIGFAADAATQSRQLRALAFVLRKLIRSVDEEIGEKE